MYIELSPDLGLPSSPSSEGLVDQLVQDSASYRLLSGNEPIECIEPRPKDAPKQGMAIQTPGGEGGRAQDRALVRSVLEEQFVPMQQVMQEPPHEGENIGTGHQNGCKFLFARPAILEGLSFLVPFRLTANAEAEQQKSETIIRMGIWLGYYARKFGIDLAHMTTAANRIAVEAKAHREEALDTRLPEEEILHLIDQRFPRAKNVYPVLGELAADVYVTNHSPKGLVRAKLHRNGVQAFHDNLGFTVTHGLQEAQRLQLKGADAALCVVAPVMRTAETITAINRLRLGRGQSPLRHYQADMRTQQLRVTREKH